MWDILRACSRPGLEEEEEAENFKWKTPDLLYIIQTVRLIVLGSIWNKCSFYGLFCWGSSSILNWQDVLPHLLEMVTFWRGSSTPVPYGFSRSGAPNTCAFQHESELVRGTLLLSFITYFVVVPLTYVGGLWNYDVTFTCGQKITWACLSAWRFIWAFLVNVVINSKFMVSLATLLSVQAHYIGSDHGTAQYVVGVLSCILGASTAFHLWVVMQHILREDMFKHRLISYDPDYSFKEGYTNFMFFSIAGALTIVMYCICGKPLRGSPLFQFDLALGALWLCLSVLACRMVYLLAVPSWCTVRLLPEDLIVVIENQEVEGPHEDVEMQAAVVTDPPNPATVPEK